MPNTFLVNFSRELKKQIRIWYGLKCKKLLSQIMRCSSSIFRENHVFMEEEYEVVVVEEELGDINIDDIY